MLGSLIDSAMDLTVAPGYTKLGYRTRRALGWTPLEPGSMRGRRVIVTGASAGLGLASARLLGELGADVHILVRDRGRGERAAEQISGDGEGEVRVEVADLSSLSSVRAFASHFSSRHRGLHVLINNAGVLAGERDLSVDGHELTFATNVLGMFVLTNELLPQLMSGAPSRIINVSSGGMYTARLDVSDLESEDGDYSGPAAYSRSKRAQVVLTELWAERLRGTGIVVHAMHPGLGRHPGGPGLAADLPPAHRATAAQPAGRRGHDRLACERTGGGAVQRPVLARPAPAQHPPAAVDARERGRPAGAVGGVHARRRPQPPPQRRDTRPPPR